MTPIRTAVVGYGTSGAVFHAPLLAADDAFEVSFVVTGSPARAAAAASAHPGAVVVPSVDALFRRAGDIDLVVIGTPNATHAPIAHRAVEAGKHVVVDKPIAVSSQEAAAMVEHAGRAGVVLTVFQNRRWDGDFLTLKGLLATSQLGEVRSLDSAFEWYRPNPTKPWKDSADPGAGGGVVYDIAPHLLDQAVQLFGPVREVHAELDRRRPGAVTDDDSFLAVTHDSGVRVRLWMSSVAPVPRPRFRLVTDTGVLRFDGLDPQESQLAAGRRPRDVGYGLHEDHRTATFVGPDGVWEVEVGAGRYPEFYRGLAEAIRSGAPAPVDPADSIAVLALIEAAVASAR